MAAKEMVGYLLKYFDSMVVKVKVLGLMVQVKAFGLMVQVKVFGSMVQLTKKRSNVII